MERCDIIIPVWNEHDITKECIDSILRHTSYPYRLIIIDNASDGQTAEYLETLKIWTDTIFGTKMVSVPNISILRNEMNLGFVKAVNQGIKASDAPFLCIMNNDTIATNGWLSEMIAIMNLRKEIGLLNPSSNTSGQYPRRGESIDECAWRRKRYKGRIQELYMCRGFCMLLRREVVGRIGLLDEAYHIGYFDDTDYCKRAQAAGYRTARARGAYVYHKENVSFKKLEENNSLFRKNERVFFEKWGRQVRIGYFVKRVGPQGAINDIAISVARSGHQIIIFLRKGLTWPVTIDHFDIRRIDINNTFFGLVSMYKILKRMRKKRLDILVTNSRSFGSFLMMTRFLHRADVFVNPDKEAVLEKIKIKSREF